MTLAIVLIILTAIYGTWQITYSYMIRKMKSNACPFYSDCSTSLQLNDPAATSRKAANLLIKNIEADTHYKQSLRRFLEQEHSS